jgi:Cu-processing system ATP-binding protein
VEAVVTDLAPLQTIPLPCAVIEGSDITKCYGRVPVLRGIDLSVRAGRVTAVLGPNGAGKSTLVRVLLGLVRPDEGTVTVAGTPVGDGPAYRAAIGYMPQQPQFPENLTGREVVRLLRELRGQPIPEDDALFQAFGLTTELDKPVRVLSGGTKQKLNAALAFMFRPRILLLDEPTAGLDPVASGVLKARILEARQAGVSVLLVSHVLSEVEDLADDVLLLLDGQVEFQGSLRGLRDLTGETRLEQAVAHLMRRRAS